MRDGAKQTCRNAQRAAHPNPCAHPLPAGPRAPTKRADSSVLGPVCAGLKPGLAIEEGNDPEKREQPREGWSRLHLAACVNLQPKPLQRLSSGRQTYGRWCASAKLRLGRIFEVVSLDSESTTPYKIEEDAAHLSARSTNRHFQIDCTWHK